MDIYEALKKDHVEIKDLLDELVSLKDNDDYRFVVIEEIRNHLIPHARAEESVFYNTLRAIHADRKLILHGYQEHLEAETLLRTLQLMDKLNMEWKATAKKLRDSVFHHIQDEETEVFDEARAAFTDEEAVSICEAFEQLKPKIEQEGAVKTTMDMLVNMMPPRLSDKLRHWGGGEIRP